MGQKISERLRQIKQLPPEEGLSQLLEQIVQLTDIRFSEASRANARLLTVNKLAKDTILVMRSLQETSEHELD